MKIVIAQSDAQLAACYQIILQLRPHLTEQMFIENVQRMSHNNAYQVAFLQEKDIKAVAGFRVSEWLHSGKYLEIEELITAQNERSNGYGGKLFDWLVDHAIKQNCKQVRLVSGVKREDAHRFYLTKGMQYEAKYFSMDIELS